MQQELLVSIVLPLLNEGQTVAKLHQVLGVVLDDISSDRPEVRFELLFIDDGSLDDTWQELTKLAGEDYRVRSFRLARNFGKEAAIRAGLERALGDAVIVMDADLQHPPSLIKEMLEIWTAAQVDIVEAVKKSRGKESLAYKVSASVFYFLMDRVCGLDLKGSSDFRLLNRKAVNSLLKMQERMTFFRGMSTWVGYQRAQVSFDVLEREEGCSSWSLAKLIKLTVSSVASYSSAPLYVASMLGCLFLVFAFVLGCQTVYNLWSGNAVSGFTTVIILQLLIGSIIMIAFGVLGVYVATIYDEVKRRPQYIVSEQKDRTKSPS